MPGINNLYELDYKNLLKDVLVNGSQQEVRDGNSAKAMFGKSLQFNNKFGFFPMLTSKEMYFKNVKYELSWILKGLTNVDYLKSNGVSIWNKWANEAGEIGDTYGRQLRGFNGIDQLVNTLENLAANPQGRQHVISLWNPVAISQGNLKPCYHAFQFVCIGNMLHILVSQRSADLFIGLPYDMAVFCLLLNLVCKKYDFVPGLVKINIGNAHIYAEHTKPVLEYLNNPIHDLPTIANYQDEVINFDTSKVSIKHYVSEGFIKAKIII